MKKKPAYIDLTRTPDFNKARRIWAKQCAPAEHEAEWEKTSKRMGRYSRMQKDLPATSVDSKRRKAA